MGQFTITFQPGGVQVTVPEGTTLLRAQIQAGLGPDAPCGGRGSCGKCRVTLQDGREVLACQTPVEGDQVVYLGRSRTAQILTGEADVSEMPIQYVSDFTPKYNAEICAALGLTAPEGYEAIATEAAE